MKLSLASFLLFTVAAIAQQDVPVPYTPSDAVVLGYNLTFAASGPGGANNNFIVQTLSPSENGCLSFTNNEPGTTHYATVAVYAAYDPATTSYSGNTGKWLLSSQLLNATLSAGGTYVAQVPASGGRRIAFVVTTNTAQSSKGLDLIYTRLPIGQSCAGAKDFSANGGNLPPPGKVCNVSQTTVVTSNSTAEIGGVSSAGTSWGICSVQISYPASTTAVNDTVQFSTTFNCSGITGPALGAAVSSTAGSQVLLSTQGPTLTQFESTWPWLCYVHGNSGGAVVVNVTYGYW